MSPEEIRDAFVVAATEQHRTRAEALLSAHPELERDPWARLVLGRGWDGDARAPGGPRGWAHRRCTGRPGERPTTSLPAAFDPATIARAGVVSARSAR